jgi:eukaryotic-like serine/threonine-protein kinase
MGEEPAAGDRPSHAGEAFTDRLTIPEYDILEELGRGGMGVVFKARHRPSGRPVAIKVIRDGTLASPQQRDRFRIEAEALLRLRHPNIVQIHAAGEQFGRPYFVMELVEGQGLDQHLGGQLWPLVRAADLLRTLAQAIQHAHDNQVVHRDLKPANILLSVASVSISSAHDGSTRPPVASPLTPKITDFGLAKRLDADSTGWTLEGAILGTPAYMAPEQAAGRISEIGPAVDIYSLGIILYEALTGRPPFQAETRIATIQLVLQEEAEPPTASRPEVPRDLEVICLTCLEKDPARRYESAAALAEDLDRFLHNRPINARALGALERLNRHARRDGYQVLKEIGHGPRSIVYQARDSQLRRSVAVKVFTSGMCTRESWEAQLRVDAERWATLTHPQVMPLQRAGWWDRAPYLAREYGPQGTLADKLGGRPWPINQALMLTEQLAAVVAYLHRQGVVHGNLKPSNVLLAANGIPRLTDFRLSGNLFQASKPEDESVASLAYLTPELATDPMAEPRPYTDIYGLGILLYELLTGRQPFDGVCARDMREQVQTREPTSPSLLNPDVSPQLDLLCGKCLHKNPWRRYTRAHDLASQLRRFLDESDAESGDKRRAPGRPRDR